MTRKIEKKWLWLLIPGIPAAVLCVLFLPFALIAGSELMGAIIGPVNVWNSTTRVPLDPDLLGSYRYSRDGSANDGNPHITVPDDSGFTLEPNNELEVHNLPKIDGFGKPTGCDYNGTGKWSVSGGGVGFSLAMDIKTVVPANPGNAPSCDAEYLSEFAILGKAKPYRFWYYIGDPDEDEGLLYKLR